MRRFRAVGGAGVVVGILMATLGAASAFASESTFNANSYPASYSGVAQGSFHLSGNYEDGFCSDFDFEAQASGPAETLSGSVNGATCSTPVEMNGCKLEFHPGSEGQFGSFSGSYDIGPAGCGPIETRIDSCYLSIPAQTGLSATYENVTQGGQGVVDIASVTDLTVNSKHMPGCPSEAWTEAHLAGEWELSRTGSGDVWAEQASHEPLFEAENYPATLEGSQDSPDKFAFTFEQGMQLTCTVADFSGGLSAAGANLLLSPTFTGCKAFEGIGVTVKPNGCSFDQFAGLRVGTGEYLGTLGIDCPGKGIEVVSGTCGLVLEPQEGLEGVGYVNRDSGFSIGDAIGAGVSYTKTKDGLFCPLAGTGAMEDGQLQVKIGVEGDEAIRVGG